MATVYLSTPEKTTMKRNSSLRDVVTGIYLDDQDRTAFLRLRTTQPHCAASLVEN
jgi:hypothetical protein